MNIDNNYDYQEWYLRDLTATQNTQESKLSQKTAADVSSEPEKQARTDVVDFGKGAQNAIEAARANGVSETNKSEQNDLAQAATTQDNQLSKGMAAAPTDNEPVTTDSKPELKLRLHTANIDRYEGAKAPEKPQPETADSTSEVTDNKQKITAAQQRSIAAYQQQQGYTNSLVMSQSLAASMS